MLEHSGIKWVIEMDARVGLMLPTDGGIHRSDRANLDGDGRSRRQIAHLVVNTATLFRQVYDGHIARAIAGAQTPHNGNIISLLIAVNHSVVAPKAVQRP